MERITEILNEVKSLSDRAARIETHLEHQRYQFDKIEQALGSLDPLKVAVENHEVKIKGVSWVLGLFISLISAKVFGKF